MRVPRRESSPGEEADYRNSFCEQTALRTQELPQQIFTRQLDLDKRRMT